MDWQEILIAAIAGGVLTKLIEAFSNAFQAYLARKQVAAQVHSTEADTAAKLQSVSVSQGDEWRELYTEQKQLREALETRVAALETEFRQTLKAEHTRAAEQESKYIDEIRELRERIETLEQDVQARQIRITVLESKIESLNNVHVENMTLKAQVEKLQRDNDRLTRENAELRAQIEALTKRLSALERKGGTAPLTSKAEPTQS